MRRRRDAGGIERRGEAGAALVQPAGDRIERGMAAGGVTVQPVTRPSMPIVTAMPTVPASPARIEAAPRRLPLQAATKSAIWSASAFLNGGRSSQRAL